MPLLSSLSGRPLFCGRAVSPQKGTSPGPFCWLGTPAPHPRRRSPPLFISPPPLPASIVQHHVIQYVSVHPQAPCPRPKHPPSPLFIGLSMTITREKCTPFAWLALSSWGNTSIGGAPTGPSSSHYPLPAAPKQLFHSPVISHQKHTTDSLRSGVRRTAFEIELKLEVDTRLSNVFSRCNRSPPLLGRIT